MKLIDLQRSEFDQQYSGIMHKLYPFEFKFGYSIMMELFDLYRSNKNFEPRLLEILSNVKLKKNYPFFWFDNGVDIETAFLYQKTYKVYKIDLCQWCNTAFCKKDGYKSCCCEDHFQKHMLRRNGRLSESRKLYNPRDPKQYAERHCISLQTAEEIVDKFARESSHFTIEYWVQRGYSIEDSNGIIQNLQKSNSKRCPEYWIKNGKSETEAHQEVSKHQQKDSLQRFAKYTKEEISLQSSFNPKFWQNRGYDESTSIEISRQIQKKGADSVKKKYTEQERKEFNCRCTEYWQKRHGDNWKEEYVKFLQSVKQTGFRSKIADDFCETLASHFNGDSLYFGDTEYAMQLGDKGFIKIDFTNTTRNFCVEFHGDYWHANPELYEENEMISYPNSVAKKAGDIWVLDSTRADHIREKGFKLFVVWESEYKTDKIGTIKKLLQRIENEN